MFERGISHSNTTENPTQKTTFKTHTRRALSFVERNGTKIACTVGGYLSPFLYYPNLPSDELSERAVISAGIGFVLGSAIDHLFRPKVSQYTPETPEQEMERSSRWIAHVTKSLADSHGTLFSLAEDGLPDEATRVAVAKMMEANSEDPITIDEISRGVDHHFWTDAQWATTLDGSLDTESDLFNRAGTIVLAAQLSSQKPNLLTDRVKDKLDELKRN